MVLDERHETMEKAISSMDVSSSTPKGLCTPCKLLLLLFLSLLVLPRTLRSIVAKFLTVEPIDMAQLFVALIQGT
jgi:hypothetical protein